MTLSKSYQEIMNHIEVTDEMKARILENIADQYPDPLANGAAPDNESERKSQSATSETSKKIINLPGKWNYRKLASAAACVAVLVIGVSAFSNVMTGGSASSTAYDTAEEANGTALQNDFDAAAVSPSEEYNSLEELEEQAGFAVNAPAYLPFKATGVTFSLYDRTIAEICYISENEDLVFRTSGQDAAGLIDEDEYPIVETKELNGTTITMEGEEVDNADNVLYMHAFWQKDGYSYSISSTTGLTEEEMGKIIESVG